MANDGKSCRYGYRGPSARADASAICIAASADCDGILRAFGMPVSKLTPLHVEWDGRVVNKAESFFSKTKAAHRCDAQPLTAAHPAQHGQLSI